MQDGWIKLHRKTIDSEWFTDVNTNHLYIYCLLKANHERKSWRGVVIERGQFATSLPTISRETGLSVQKIRTSLGRLKLTGNLTDKTYSKYRLISITNYDSYQSANRQANRDLTGNQQASNRQVTATKNEKNEKNEKKLIIYSSFEEFWNLYGIKKGRHKCEMKYQQLLKSGIAHEDIIKGVKLYKNEVREKGTEKQFIKQPLTWLNGKCWLDEYEITLTREEKLEMRRRKEMQELQKD